MMDQNNITFNLDGTGTSTFVLKLPSIERPTKLIGDPANGVATHEIGACPICNPRVITAYSTPET